LKILSGKQMARLLEKKDGNLKEFMEVIIFMQGKKELKGYQFLFTETEL